jgi:hypothetical protein
MKATIFCVLAIISARASTATIYDRGGGCQASRMYRARLLD